MALTKPVVAKKETAAVETVAVETAVEKENLTVQGVEETVAAAPETVVAEETVVETPAEETLTEEGVAAVAEEPQQQVAVAQEAKQPSVVQAQANAMAQFTDTMAEAGFEGLTLSSMSFDRIKLHEGQFKIGSDEAELGTDFDCIVHAIRKIFVVRQSTDNDAESFYSYDAKGATFTDGSSAAEKLQDWLEDGYGTEDEPLDIREYLECTATLVDRDDEYDEQMVMLSIPPASAARFSGVAAQAYMKFKGALLSDVVIRCTVGKKIGEGQKAFRPWVPKVLRRIDA